MGKIFNLNLRDTVGNIFATSTFRQSSITFLGTFVNAVLGAVFYILCARFLGPASFGLMSVAIVTMTLVADIGGLGTDTGLVRFVSKHVKTDLSKAYRFLKLGLEVKLVVSVAVLVLGFLLAPFIAGSLFAKPELTTPLRISFIGVGGALLFSFMTHALQSFQKFWAWGGIQVVTNLVRLVVVIILLWLAKLNLENTLLSYITMPFLGFFIGLTIISPNFLKVKDELSVSSDFFHYNKWVAAFTLVAAFSARLDTFMSARLLPIAQVGLYSAANQLVQIVPQIVTALGTVISPKMASMGGIKDFVSYLKKTQIMVCLLALVGLIFVPVVLFLIPILYGSAYLETGTIFIILLFAMLIFLISVPIHMSVFYYFSYPKLFFWLSLGHLAIVGLLGWRLISIYGAVGAALAVLVGQTFDFVVPAIWVLRKITSRQSLRQLADH